MTAEPPTTPRVHVTVPFFSNVAYLELALRSLVAQTDRDWTAHVVDDASPEPGAESLVTRLGDDRIRYIRNQRNLGVSGNFNHCLDLGAQQADVVVVFHADDLLEPEYIAAVRRAHMEFPDASCVAPRVRVIDADGRAARTVGDTVKQLMWPRRLPAIFVGDDGLARLMHGQFFYCPSVSYRLELLPVLRFDLRWRQVMDLDFYARVLLGGGSIVFPPEWAYRYRRHPATMTAQNSRSLVRLVEEVEVSREVAAMAHEVGWRRAERAARRRVTVRLNGVLHAAAVLARGDVRAARSAAAHALSR
jgi:glycosyltransferase involved in cell wall biosynthesis